MKYRWNLKDINKRKKYVLDRLKNKGVSALEKQSLVFSLVSYNEMLENSGTIRYTWLHNSLDAMTNNKYRLIKSREEIRLADGIVNFSSILNNEFLAMLIRIAENVSKLPVPDYQNMEYVFFSETDLVEIVKEFYQWIGPNKVSSTALDILNKNNVINLCTDYRHCNEHLAGICYCDSTFKESFCNIYNDNTIYVPQTIAHEIMHAVENNLSKINTWEDHPSTLEIVTNFIDLLFVDFLESKNIAKNEINKIRCRYYRDMIGDALVVIPPIEIALQKKGLTLKSATIEEIKSVISYDMYYYLYRVYNYVFGLGLYNSYNDNKALTMRKIEQITIERVPTNIVPDFEYIGFDILTLVEISENIGNDGMVKSQNLTFSNNEW